MIHDARESRLSTCYSPRNSRESIPLLFPIFVCAAIGWTLDIHIAEEIISWKIMFQQKEDPDESEDRELKEKKKTKKYRRIEFLWIRESFFFSFPHSHSFAVIIYEEKYIICMSDCAQRPPSHWSRFCFDLVDTDWGRDETRHGSHNQRHLLRLVGSHGTRCWMTENVQS